MARGCGGETELAAAGEERGAHSASWWPQPGLTPWRTLTLLLGMPAELSTLKPLITQFSPALCRVTLICVFPMRTSPLPALACPVAPLGFGAPALPWRTLVLAVTSCASPAEPAIAALVGEAGRPLGPGLWGGPPRGPPGTDAPENQPSVAPGRALSHWLWPLTDKPQDKASVSSV